MPKPKTVWRHYKGNVYTIVDVATHTEDQVPMVIYRDRWGETSADLDTATEHVV